MGLPVEGIRRHYETVAQRIGVSGPQTQSWVQPPLPMDHNALSVQRWAARNRRKLTSVNCTAVQPHSAILSQDLGTRKASSVGDMEYWADPGRSVWRPQYTLDALSASPHFSYEGGWIVQRIERKDGQLLVYAVATQEHVGQTRMFSARRVVLACGAVNTARVLLASLGKIDVDVPFLAKPRMLAACLNPHAIGQAGPAERISLCQQLIIDHTLHAGLERACAQLYSYRALMLFRLVGSIPLPMPQALRLASLLASSLVIADIRFPALQSDAATLRLRDNGIAIQFPSHTAEERARRDTAWKSTRRALLATHLIPCKRIFMPEGATVHYAGTVPMGDIGEAPLTCDADGRSMQLPGVWIADASSFRALPAKPHTFTLMANACRVADAVLKEG
jgi:choline dehydrogenase-like flavoprotein